jgi:aminoglycoside N3'-acetyltransferase
MDITRESIRRDLRNLGVVEGDVVLVRAGLKAVGAVEQGNFLDALLDAVESRGTVASLAFTRGGLAWQASKIPPYTLDSVSYAGALPNMMITHPHAHRSLHPQCSIVAIGKHAQQLTDGHGPHSRAYEPVRKLIALKAKMLVVGCVGSSPGFTTAHLAEADLGLHRRRIAPWLAISRYFDEHGAIRTFYRTDPGLCSKSFWKFYAAYVKSGHLTTGLVGKAYSICAPAAECYAIEHEILANNKVFAVCDSADCVVCNVLRWDRIYRWPAFLFERLFRNRNH